MVRIKNKFGENTRIVYTNIFYALVIKGGGLIISFLMIPLLIKYFNNNFVLGIWFSLISILTWFLNFDLGIGNGVRNNLVRDLVKKDYYSASKTISSGFFSVACISILLFALGISLIYNINLNKLLNIDESLISKEVLCKSSVFLFIAFMVRFFLSIITSILYSLQKSSLNNLSHFLVSFLQLVYLLLFDFNNSEEALRNISFAYIFISNIPILFIGILIFNRELKGCKPSFKFVDTKHIKQITNIGGVFFVCQILYMIIANTNEFFITNLYSPENTSEYTYYYRIFTLGTMIISLATTPIWSVVTKAQVEGNYSWLKRILRVMDWVALVVLLIQLSLIPFVQLIMDIWLEKGLVSVENKTSLAFAFFSTLFVYSSMISTISNGLSYLKVQLITFLMGGVLKIILLYTCYSFTNWDFIVWINAFILLLYIIFQHNYINKFLKSKMI